MRYYTTILSFLFAITLSHGQSASKKFIVIQTIDTIKVKEINSDHVYVRTINKPDTIYLGENGFIFENNALDKPAEFVGGKKMLIQWLTENFKYPDAARAKNIQGKVLIRFVVDEYGKIMSPTVLKSVDPILDAEALRLVAAMPNWIAGERARQKVRSYVTLPVNFRLGN